MTAMQTFYSSLEQDLLPASVPVVEGGRVIGLATTSVDWLGNRDAEEIILSKNPQERAVAAIFAARQAHVALELVH